MARVSAGELGLDLDHWCFGCGQANPHGLRLDFEFSADRAESSFTAAREQQGYDGMAHGGILTTLLDEAMGWSALHQGIWGVTTRLAVTFRRPVRLGEEVRVVGEIVRDRGRALELRGEIRRASDDELIATAAATYVKMSEAQKRTLMEKYGEPAQTSQRVTARVRGRE